MRYVLITFALVAGLCEPVMAQEDWLCVHEASQRRGNEVLACGIATAPSEPQARKEAFLAAKDEFRLVCDVDASCLNRVAVVTPSRTECEREPSGAFRCLRLIIFTLGGAYVTPGEPSPFNRKQAVSGLAEPFALANSLQPAPQRLPQPPTARLPVGKLRVGMSSHNVLKLLGQPKDVADVAYGVVVWSYEGLGCDKWEGCMVHVRGSHVVALSGVLPGLD